MFAFLKKKSHILETASRLYLQIVAQARNSFFYRELGVPDTTDGRFEMIVLCSFFAFEQLRLNRNLEAVRLAQGLFDHMFTDMDQSLRESGVGDLGVPRHMKRMMAGFNGRITSYGAALAKGDDPALLLDALKRNVYGTVKDIDEEKIEKLAHYVRMQAMGVNGDELLGGDIAFLDPEDICCD